jgi:ABC-type multidrug transport system permease subunit
MGSILRLTLKDVKRRFARPAGMLINLSIPLVLAGMLALVFTGRDDEPPHMNIVVADEDQGPLSRFVTGATQNEEAAKYLDVVPAATRDEGLEILRDQDATALLVIPKGFSDTLLANGKAELELVKNPAQRIMPVVAQQGAEVLSLYLTVARAALGDETATLQKLFEGKGWDNAVGVAALVTVIYARTQEAEPLLFPPLIEVETSGADATADAGDNFSPIAWLYPGMVVMGLLFAGTAQMRDLLDEAQAGTLRRLLAAPLGPVQILISKILSTVALVAIAQTIFLITGRLAFGINWGPILPMILTSMVLSLAVTGFASMIYAAARTQRQGDAFGGILIMLMSLVGGAFVPVEILPDWLKNVSRGTLNYWATESLRALATGGGFGAGGGLQPALMGLATVGAAFTLVGAFVMHRRHVKGAV